MRRIVTSLSIFLQCIGLVCLSAACGCARVEERWVITAHVPERPSMRPKTRMQKIPYELANVASNNIVQVNLIFDAINGESQDVFISGIAVSNGYMTIYSSDGWILYGPDAHILSVKGSRTNVLQSSHPHFEVWNHASSAGLHLNVANKDIEPANHLLSKRTNDGIACVPVTIKFSADFRGNAGSWDVYRRQ